MSAIHGVSAHLAGSVLHQSPVDGLSSMRGIGLEGEVSMRRVAVEQQRWIMKGLWFLPTFIFMAWVAGFPLQTQAQTPCPRAVQCVPDGVLTITFSISGDTSGCEFTATVNWGDGEITGSVLDMEMN